MQYELQVFDGKQYEPVTRGDKPAALLGSRTGRPRRVIKTERAKPLTLRPRKVVPSRSAKRKPETQIEPAYEITLVQRAIDWYEKRLQRGESVTVYYWRGSRFGAEIIPWSKHRDNVKLVMLDPDEPRLRIRPDDRADWRHGIGVACRLRHRSTA